MLGYRRLLQIDINVAVVLCNWMLLMGSIDYTTKTLLVANPRSGWVFVYATGFRNVSRLPDCPWSSQRAAPIRTGVFNGWGRAAMLQGVARRPLSVWVGCNLERERERERLLPSQVQLATLPHAVWDSRLELSIGCRCDSGAHLLAEQMPATSREQNLHILFMQSLLCLAGHLTILRCVGGSPSPAGPVEHVRAGPRASAPPMIHRRVRECTILM